MTGEQKVGKPFQRSKDIRLQARHRNKRVNPPAPIPHPSPYDPTKPRKRYLLGLF